MGAAAGEGHLEARDPLAAHADGVGVHHREGERVGGVHDRAERRPDVVTLGDRGRPLIAARVAPVAPTVASSVAAVVAAVVATRVAAVASGVAGALSLGAVEGDRLSTRRVREGQQTIGPGEGVLIVPGDLGDGSPHVHHVHLEGREIGAGDRDGVAIDGGDGDGVVGVDDRAGHDRPRVRAHHGRGDVGAAADEGEEGQGTQGRRRDGQVHGFLRWRRDAAPTKVLSAMTEAVHRRFTARTPLPLELGEVHFDRAALLVGGEERRLRPLELRLLAYMADNPDIVLSPADVLREVWEYADGVETRTLYATVNRLRLTLERDPHQPRHILTVPRQGYRFVPLVATGKDDETPEIVGVEPLRVPPPLLPPALRPCVGREEALTALAHLVTDRPLVTLRGPAGVGKSRLALELARRPDLLGTPRRIVWCALENVDSLSTCLTAVATALQPGTGPLRSAQQLTTTLAARAPLLLILDDADRAAPSLLPLLAGWLEIEGLHVLVTSRARLGRPGEIQYTLAPLALRDAEGRTLAGPAVRLLEARVREHRPDVDLPADEPWVAALLHALGGLPLAIELAAPWLSVMSGPELLEQVARDPVGLPGAGNDEDGDPRPDTRTEPRREGARSRHQSIAASLSWSWPLLTTPERTTLLQCAVFRGPFDLPAARAVVGTTVAGAPLHEILLRLVERSWLRVEPVDASQWFSLYKGHREFLLAQAPPDLLETSRARHVRFHADQGRQDDVESVVVRGGSGWTRLKARGPDLKAALDSAEGPDAIALALVISRMLLAEGPLDQCCTVTRRALTAPDLSRADRMALHRHLAVALRHLGQADEARCLLTESLAAHPAPGVLSRETGRTWRTLGVLELYHGHPAAGRSALEHARDLHHAAGDTLDEAIALAELGTLEFHAGNHRAAVAQLEAGLAILREDGERGVYAVYLVNLGVVELIAGQLESASLHLHEALALHRRSGAVRFEALALGNLAHVEERRGRYPEALELAHAALALARQAGDRGEEANVWSMMGLIHLSAGEVGAAGIVLERAWGLATSLSIPRLQAEVCTRRARVYLAREEIRAALEFVDRAEAISTTHHLQTEGVEAGRVRVEIWLHQGDGTRARAAWEALVPWIEGEPPDALVALRARVEGLEGR